MDVENLMLKYNSLMSLPENRNAAVIKSNIMFKCIEAASEQKQTLDTGPYCCKWCLNVCTPNNCNINLQPQKRPKHHLRSLLKKDPNTLNKFQCKLVSKLKRQAPSNKLIFTCNYCNKDTSILTRKGKDEETDEADKNIVIESKKKKKKKRVELYAGLNVAVIENLKKPSPSELNKKVKKNITPYGNTPQRKMPMNQIIQVYKAIQQAPNISESKRNSFMSKRKPSLLENFLNNM